MAAFRRRFNFSRRCPGLVWSLLTFSLKKEKDVWRFSFVAKLMLLIVNNQQNIENQSLL